VNWIHLSGDWTTGQLVLNTAIKTGNLLTSCVKLDPGYKTSSVTEKPVTADREKGEFLSLAITPCVALTGAIYTLRRQQLYCTVRVK